MLELIDNVYYYDGDKYEIEGSDSNIIFLKSEDGNSMLVASKNKLYVYGKINGYEGVGLS